MQARTLKTIGEALGSLSEHLGAAGFEDALAGMLGELLPHDMMSVARYSLSEAPEIIAYSTGMPDAVVDGYARFYRDIDPYAVHWRNRPDADVITLSALKGERKVDRYIRELLFDNGIRDEIGIFLPRLAGCGLGLFYESARRRYGAPQEALLKTLYPMIANLYRVHLRTLFAVPSGDLDASPTPSRVMLLSGSRGETLWSTPAWEGLPEAVRTQQREAARSMHTHGTMRHTLSGSGALVSEKISDTPHRVVWTVAPANAGSGHPISFEHALGQFEQKLTRRELDIVKLVLKGYPTLSIAGRLGLSRGTVKNHRRRIYDKLDITTERELFLMYIEAAAGSGEPET